MVITGATGAIGSYLIQQFGAMAWDPRTDSGVNTAALVNCMGVNHDSLFHESDPIDWNNVIHVNLIDTLDTIRAVLPYMRKEKYGRIINISSMLSDWAVQGTSAYTASKAGLNAAIRVIAKENAKYNILINNINLGYIDIGMTHKIKNRETLEKNIPLGFGHPSEITKAVNFLLYTKYITGTTININGGLW